MKPNNFSADYTAIQGLVATSGTAIIGGGGSSLSPSGSVTDETSWGISPSAGAATTYSRGDHTHGSPASAVASINFLIDGGGSTITTGVKGDVVLDFACTVTNWTLLADTSGAIVVDVWRDAYASFPPTDADAMPGSGSEPTITASGVSAQGSAAGWSRSTIAAGDTLRFNVDSCTSITRAVLGLKVTRT